MSLEQDIERDVAFWQGCLEGLAPENRAAKARLKELAGLRHDDWVAKQNWVGNIAAWQKHSKALRAAVAQKRQAQKGGQ